MTDLHDKARAYLELASKATPGPWFKHQLGRIFVGPGRPGNLAHIVYSSCDNIYELKPEASARVQSDATFIAASHDAAQIIRELLAENEALVKGAARYRWLANRDNPKALTLMKLYQDQEELGRAIDIAIADSNKADE